MNQSKCSLYLELGSSFRIRISFLQFILPTWFGTGARSESQVQIDPQILTKAGTGNQKYGFIESCFTGFQYHVLA
jgi:hypothetical protein